MKQLIFLTLFILILSYSHAQTTENKEKKPDIFFEEKTIDFGSIEDGKAATVEFKFYNSGTAPLLLKSVKASCGCTASDWPRQPIMPGQSSKISARFNSKGYAGRNVSKSVTVTTNVKQSNGKDKVIILNFKGSVKPKGS